MTSTRRYRELVESMRTIEQQLDHYSMLLEGHLIWVGGMTSAGYGEVRVNGGYQYAHRLAWVLAYGSIPEGLNILHRCDTPPCIEPRHLYAGTQADNAGDMVRAGHHYTTNRTHCPQGHPYDEDNTYLWRGVRWCRACKLEGQRRRRRAQR